MPTAEATVPVKAREKKEVVRRRPLWGLFDDLGFDFDRGLSPLLRGLEPLGASSWMPRVDIYEEKGTLFVNADLPGLERKDVDVSVEEGALLVKGERREKKETRERNYIRSECSTGSFLRRIQLPEGVDPGLIRADFSDGVLKVRVPLPPEEKPERFEVPVL